ncbi:MAG: hypothetical protein KDA56_10895 [Hyphomonas sp.]|nr:hypothetical protein [Hyphomonas sp.]
MHTAFAFALVPYLMLQNASGLECSCSDKTAEERIAEAAYAFEVTARGTGDLCDGNIYREGEKPWLTQVEVMALRKGEMPEEALTFIRHDQTPNACGFSLTPGRRYLVFGQVDERGFYEADACTVVPSQGKP